jgi:uncharacterized protein (DUF2141 family)
MVPSLSSFAAIAAALGLTSVLLLPAEAAPGPNERPVPVELMVRVAGLKNDRGRVAVALFASAPGFPKQEHAARGELARIDKGQATVRFRDLLPGTYAVAVLHDENENSKMDFNFLGMPLEGYGFSNDAAVLLGPPSFESAAFRLLQRPSEITIRARYFSF